MTGPPQPDHRGYSFVTLFPGLATFLVREKVAWDYRLKALNEWGVHPVDLMRQQLLSLGAIPMVHLPHYGHVTTAGVVIAKQRPPTAKVFAFYVIEDGPSRLQVIISPDLWEVQRDVLREAKVLIVTGLLEKKGRAWTLRAELLADAQASPAFVKLALH